MSGRHFILARRRVLRTPSLPPAFVAECPRFELQVPNLKSMKLTYRKATCPVFFCAMPLSPVVPFDVLSPFHCRVFFVCACLCCCVRYLHSMRLVCVWSLVCPLIGSFIALSVRSFVRLFVFLSVRSLVGVWVYCFFGIC